MASQCEADSTKFLQWHSSVGLFQLSFSSGVPVYPASICWVAHWYPSVHWVNQWHSIGIPVYTGQASVHWLRVRGYVQVNLVFLPESNWRLVNTADHRRIRISAYHATHSLEVFPWYRTGTVVKENTPSRVVRGRRSLAGTMRRNPTPNAEDSDAWCQLVISRLAPPYERVFFSFILYLLVE